MSSGTRLRVMVAMTGVGAAFFVGGWLLARKDPSSGR
jgi:hypothetical protein